MSKINGEHLDAVIDEIGDNHISTSGINTPLKEGAFDLSDNEKIDLIQEHFKDILDIIGLDLNDDSIQGTPRRLAKMYINELFSGINPKNEPSVSLFENKYKYSEMLVEKNISFVSMCEHHFLPIIGQAHVAYIANEKVIGLSKINRYVRYYAQRPQVQERFTEQIVAGLKETLDTEHVAVVIEAKHMCVSIRGVKDESSSTLTSAFSGDFKKEEVQEKFLAYIGSDFMKS